MVYIKPSKSLSSILNQSTLKSKTSLHGILRDVKKAAGGLGKDKQMQVAKIIKKLNEDPDAVVTNAMSKNAIHALGSAGHLQEKYQKNAGSAIAKVQQTKAAAPAAPAGAAHQEAQEEPALTDSQKRYKESKEKMRIWALARERRRDAEKQEKGVKLGLNAWQQAAASIGKSIEEKERKRKEELENKERKKAIDLMID